MKWTTERPKEKGWYWFDEKERNVGPQVVLVAQNGTHFSVNRVDDFIGDINNIDGKWAGPIPEPDY